MPKFSETEKEIILQKLFIEGERLFTALGLKKVTIDDIVMAVGIAKASFYTFYSSKEYLYMDIVQSIQQKIFNQAEELLKQNTNFPDKERVRQVFGLLYSSTITYPIIQQINLQTGEYLQRKISPERLEEFQKSNIDAARIMQSHGVKFKYETELTSLAFQSLYSCWMFIQNVSKEKQEAVFQIIFDGIIDKVIL